MCVLFPPGPPKIFKRFQKMIDAMFCFLELEVGVPGMACALVILFYIFSSISCRYQPEIELQARRRSSEKKHCYILSSDVIRI